MKFRMILVGIFLNLLICFNCFAYQQLINIPSAEILAPKEVQLSFNDRFRPYDNDWYYLMFPGAVVGVGKNTEFSFAVPVAFTNGSTDQTYAFGIKHVHKFTEQTKLTASFRSNLLIDGQDNPFDVGFLILSHRFLKTQTRVNAGVFAVNKNDLFPFHDPGAAVGIEQPIIKGKLTYVIDWMSGDKNFTLIGTGFKYYPNKDGLITIGWYAPTSDNSRFAFIVSFAKYLNRPKIKK